MQSLGKGSDLHHRTVHRGGLEDWKACHSQLAAPGLWVVGGGSPFPIRL